MRNWFTTIKVLRRYRKSDCERKIHLEDHYDKNQQILIRVNEGATRNNAVLLPAEQLLLEALFRKGDKVVLTGDATESYARHFTDAEILSAA